MRTVLICHNARLAQVALGSLRANGIAPLLIRNAATTRSLRRSRMIAGVLLGADLQTCADAAERAIRAERAQGGIDLVMASDVQGALLANRLRDRIDVPIYPTPDSPTLERLDDKWRFGQLIAELGLPAPETIHLGVAGRIDPDAAMRAAGALGFPLVVKPTNRWASLGVAHVRAADALRAALTAMEPGLDLVAQRFVPGEDVGFGAFAREGRVLADCTFRCAPRDAAEFVDIPALREAGRRIIAATRYDGVVNFDARLDREGRIWIIECNPRFFMRMRAARFCGLDLLGLGLPGRHLRGVPAARGSFYSQGELLRLSGWRRILSGRWPLGQALRSLGETVRDPAPMVCRRMGYDPVGDPA